MGPNIVSWILGTASVIHSSLSNLDLSLKKFKAFMRPACGLEDI